MCVCVCVCVLGRGRLVICRACLVVGLCVCASRFVGSCAAISSVVCCRVCSESLGYLPRELVAWALVVDEVATGIER